MDASGAIAESYDPYGRPRVMTAAGVDGNWLTEDTATYGASAVGNPYLFTARRWDADTGLYHYRHRDCIGEPLTTIGGLVSVGVGVVCCVSGALIGAFSGNPSNPSPPPPPPPPSSS